MAKNYRCVCCRISLATVPSTTNGNVFSFIIWLKGGPHCIMFGTLYSRIRWFKELIESDKGLLKNLWFVGTVCVTCAQTPCSNTFLKCWSWSFILMNLRFTECPTIKDCMFVNAVLKPNLKYQLLLICTVSSTYQNFEVFDII